jgi:hypothetical protein
MKTIESISIWDKGQTKEATILNAYGTNLQLNNSANFWYGLLSDNMEVLASGNLTMSGQDYQEWNADEFAWDWIAAQLNLTITGDYVPPVPPAVEPTDNNLE